MNFNYNIFALSQSFEAEKALSKPFRPFVSASPSPSEHTLEVQARIKRNQQEATCRNEALNERSCNATTANQPSYTLFTSVDRISPFTALFHVLMTLK